MDINEVKKAIPLVEGSFDMSDIESHHPSAYLGVDLAIGLDAVNVQRLRKALGESKVSQTHSITVYKDYIDARAHISRGLLTNRRIYNEKVKSFVTTLRFAIRRGASEVVNTPVLSIALVHKRFGRKKKKRIKKQFGGLPFQTIIEKLFMEQLKREIWKSDVKEVLSLAQIMITARKHLDTTFKGGTKQWKINH